MINKSQLLKRHLILKKVFKNKAFIIWKPLSTELINILIGLMSNFFEKNAIYLYLLKNVLLRAISDTFITENDIFIRILYF